MAQPDGLDGSVARRDSLAEPNSDWSDDEATAVSGLPLASLATGLCYDVRMRYHCEVRPSSDVHPEDPRRIYYIYKELCRSGLVDDSKSSTLVPLPLKRIPPRAATKEEISLIHTDAHYAFVLSTTGMCVSVQEFVDELQLIRSLEMDNETLERMEHERDSIYFNKLTFTTALLSAGGAIETCLAVATRQVKNAIAVIRPPGHHAEGNAAMAFCVFNNVSVAARVCQRQLGDKCRKIMILDW
jgi:histone deacetylase 6